MDLITSNFNRIFKKKKDCTPKEFRNTYVSLGVRKLSDLHYL